MLYYNSMRKTCFAITLLLCVSFRSGAAPHSLEELFPDRSSLARELRISGEVTFSMNDGIDTSMVPEVSLSSEVRDTLETGPDIMGIRSLFLLPFPEKEEPLVFLINSMTNVSSLEGIEYYSASRNRNRTLFNRAYVLSSPAGDSPAPDPTFTVLPEEFTLPVFLEDTTFGEARYELSFKTSGDCILATLVNRTPLSLGPLKVTDSGDTVFTLLAVPMNNSLLLFASGTAKPGAGVLFRGSVERSLYNRIYALKEWLEKGFTADGA